MITMGKLRLASCIRWGSSAVRDDALNSEVNIRKIYSLLTLDYTKISFIETSITNFGNTIILLTVRDSLVSKVFISYFHSSTVNKYLLLLTIFICLQILAPFDHFYLFTNTCHFWLFLFVYKYSSLHVSQSVASHFPPTKYCLPLIHCGTKDIWTNL
uniref:Uncharacterized protein n=1 Tax=Arundo donax TaxID=35708 RepID=A0A0A9BDN3_ARUDO